MTTARPHTTHRRRTVRRPLAGALAAATLLAGAWYATATTTTGSSHGGSNSTPAEAQPSTTAPTSASPTPADTPIASPTTKTKTPATTNAASTALAAITTTTVPLPAKFPYLSAGYNNTREWTRTATAVAPNGTLRIAWPASDGIHVTPLTPAGRRSAADTVVKGAKEVGGLIAHNDGFALLTRVSDTNKWKETAAALVRYKNGRQTFRTKLTGTASHDTAPLLDGQPPAPTCA